MPFVVVWSRVLFRRTRGTLAEHAVAHLCVLGQFVLGGITYGVAIGIGVTVAARL